MITCYSNNRNLIYRPPAGVSFGTQDFPRRILWRELTTGERNRICLSSRFQISPISHSSKFTSQGANCPPSQFSPFSLLQLLGIYIYISQWFMLIDVGNGLTKKEGKTEVVQVNWKVPKLHPKLRVTNSAWGESHPNTYPAPL